MNKTKQTYREKIGEILEKWADLEHQRWAKWQAYLFSKSELTKKGYLIPKKLCKHWQRQIDTPYLELSEIEKESDRKEVRKYIPLLKILLITLLNKVKEFNINTSFGNEPKGYEEYDQAEAVDKYIETLKKNIKEVKRNEKEI